jgi:hypothetical protein
MYRFTHGVMGCYPSAQLMTEALGSSKIGIQLGELEITQGIH